MVTDQRDKAIQYLLDLIEELRVAADMCGVFLEIEDGIVDIYYRRD
ncbi:hypothetical protein [Hyphomonas sp. BRH_c22]|nr:hypothetical protein [Hyphomonas sp. BRH_c22]